MSTTPDPKVDPNQGGPTIENIKGEFSRKHDALAAQVTKLAETNAALLQQIQALKSPQPKPEPKEKPIEDLLYDNPAEAVQKITQKVRGDIKRELDEERTTQQRQTKAINELYSEFPEFSDQEHDLTKKALEIYGKMEDAEKADPKALKLAGYQAAVEMGVKPKSKRAQDDDSFSFGGTSQGGRPRRDSSKLDPAVTEFAKLMGLNMDDQKVMERLKARQK